MTAEDRPYRGLSLWYDMYPGSWGPGPPLPGDRAVDVAVVGAGYTGLWTAYYLAVADPSLRVAVLEREVAGFGASGRNGGVRRSSRPRCARSPRRPAGMPQCGCSTR